MFTLALERPDDPVTRSLVMAASVALVLEERYGLEVAVKWPNDVLVLGRKICGILADHETGLALPRRRAERPPGELPRRARAARHVDPTRDGASGRRPVPPAWDDESWPELRDALLLDVLERFRASASGGTRCSRRGSGRGASSWRSSCPADRRSRAGYRDRTRRAVDRLGRPGSPFGRRRSILVTESLRMKIRPMYSRPVTLASSLAWIALTGLAYLGNVLNLPLFFNVDFLFGSVFVFIVLHYFGCVPAVVTALVSASHTAILWQHPYAVVILTLEALVVGLLYERKSRNLMFLDTVYWLLLGMPLVVLFYGGVMNIAQQSTVLIVFKQAINGIVNALIASLAITLAQHAFPGLGHSDRSGVRSPSRRRSSSSWSPSSCCRRW